MRYNVFVNQNDEVIIVRDNGNNITIFDNTPWNKTTQWSYIDNLKARNQLFWLTSFVSSNKKSFDSSWFNKNIY